MPRFAARVKIAARLTPLRQHGSDIRYASQMRTLVTIAILALSSPTVSAQSDTLTVRPFTEGIGGSVLLTNHGFGIGALARTGIFEQTSLVIEVSLGAGKDEREQEFFAGPFGETVTPFKRNYFLMLPVTAAIEQRLWTDTIEDNFRPFVQLGVGPVLGYQWPYFDDLNENGIRDPDEPLRGPLNFSGGSFRYGLSGIVSLGAYFGDAGANTIGVRIGYAMQYFTEPVDLMEPRPEIENASRQWFGSPVITIHLLGW